MKRQRRRTSSWTGGLGGGAQSPACEPTPTLFLFFFFCYVLPSACLALSIHALCPGERTNQRKRRGEEGVGLGPACQAAERRGEERKGAKGSRRRGRQDTKGTRAPFVFHPPLRPVEFSYLLPFAKLEVWRWLLDGRRGEDGRCIATVACAVGEEEGEEVSLSAIPSERFHQNTPPSLPLLLPPVILQKHLLCRRCGRLPPAVPSVPLRAALLRRTVTLSPRRTASSRFLWTLPDVDVRPQVGGSLAF